MHKIRLLLIPFVCLVLLSCGAATKKKTESAGDLYVQGVNLLNKKKYGEAIEKFMKIREDYPFDPITAVAEVKLGDAYFGKKEYLLAAGVYEDFFNAHPQDENIPYVLKQLGEAYTELSPTIDRDQAYTVKAVERFTYLKNRYPQSPYVKQAEARIEELTEKQAAHELYVGEYYYRSEKYGAAIIRLEYFLNKYPKAKNRDKALFLLSVSYGKLANPEKSNSYLEQLRREYPKSIYATSTIRRTPSAGAVKTRIETTGTAQRETSKAPRVALSDEGTPKRKEIDLRPPAGAEIKGAGLSSPAVAAPGSDGAKKKPPQAPEIVPQAGARPDQPAAVENQASSPPQPGSEGKPADTQAAAPGTATAKKDDQKKGALGFFSAEKKPIDVVSDAMEGLEKGRVIVFKGNVVAKQGDLLMFSDTLTAYLGEETNEIEKALAKGHVKIVKEDRIATCDEALFENTKGEITFKGNVVVFSGPNKVAGDTVRYFINEDRVSVESEKGKKAHVTVHPKQ